MPKNKRKTGFNIVILLVIIIPILMFAIWFFTARKPIDILIIDKTVLTKEAQEHKGLYWTLKHLKYVKPNGEFYQLNNDYFGFYPLSDTTYDIRDFDEFSNNQIDSLVSKSDIVYYTDTYGIYKNEWERRGIYRGEHSQKIYGGLSDNDYQILKKMKESKKPIIAEFNFLANPTSRRVRKKTEKLFGFEWTGWTLRYFESLDTTVNHEIPYWVINDFMEQHENQWPFTKSGIVFVHENETIFILQNEDHLINEVPVIHNTEYLQEQYGVPESFNYPFWIDIISIVDTNNKILANYKLETNQQGDSLLKYYGVPNHFPAIIEHSGDYSFLYFAGDFCDNNISGSTIYLRGISRLKRWFLDRNELNNRELFFWNYYYPLMKKTLSKQNDILKQSKKYQ